MSGKDNTIAIEECYQIMQIKKIFYVEDDLKFDSTKKSLIYDLLYLPEIEIDILQNKIREINPDFCDKIESLVTLYKNSPYKRNKEDIQKRNIEWLLVQENYEEINLLYKTISEEEIDSCKSIFLLHGLGLLENTIPYYNLVHAPSINANLLCYRFYTNFTASDQESIQKEIELSVKNKENFIFIVDDQLGDQSRSKEIIDFLTDVEAANLYGTFLLFSSKSKAMNARFDEEIYIDYIKKGTSDIGNEITKALLNSNYSMLIRKMKHIRNLALHKTYNEALNNKNIAGYLASMAEEEGVINYNLIVDWLEFNEEYYRETDQDVIDVQNLISLSSMLNKIYESQQNKICDIEKSKEMQIFEDFDYNVNNLYKAISPGDVFKIQDDYYVLIGQECDFSLRGNDQNISRKNKECILLKLDVYPYEYVPKDKHVVGFERVIIGNFKDEDDSIKTIRIDCSRSNYIDDFLLDLCSYNTNGKAVMNLRDEISLNVSYMISKYMNLRYKELNSYFNRMMEIRKTYSNQTEFENTVKLFQSGNKRIIYPYVFIKPGEIIDYPIKRICRFKKYTKLITKMHTEYRWRMEFDTINLDDIEHVMTKVFINDIEISEINTGILLTNDRNKNSKKDKRDWFIKKEELADLLDKNNIAEECKSKIIVSNDYYVFQGRAKNLLDTRFVFRKIEQNSQYQLHFTYVE